MTERRRQNILIVKLTSLGDVIHSTPCIRALRRQFPDARLWMAVERSLVPLVERNPNLDGILPARDGRMERCWRIASFGGRISWPAPLKFDLAIDLQGTPRSIAQVRASKATRQAGRGDRSGYSDPVQPDLSRHAVEVCADVLRAIDVPVDDLDPELFLGADTERETDDILDRHGLPPDGFLVVNPFSRWIAKEWPLERYAAVVRKLCATIDCQFIVTGAANEERNDLQNLLAAAPGRIVSLVGRLSLAQALCVYRRAALMLTGDSGPMHAAAALRTRVVALFGPTFPERTGPWGSDHVVLQAERPAQHHAYRSAASRSHLLSLDAETVSDAVLSAWLNVASRPRDNPSRRMKNEIEPLRERHEPLALM